MNVISKTEIKDKILEKLLLAGELSVLLKDSMKALFTRPFYFNKVVEQIVILGIGSASITAVIGLVMGLVMTLQFGYGFAKFGGVLYVPAVVSLSLVREMAPIFVSLLVAGRIGSGMVAEIGSMNVTSQVDALRALGTSPVRVLVVPRLLAAIISLPLLTIFADFLGILGGLFICKSEFGMTTGFYLNKVISTIKLVDVYTGLLKTVFFAIIITIIACYRGFKTKDGTRGVGNSTTWVVVTSSIMIMVADFLLSKIFILIFVMH